MKDTERKNGRMESVPQPVECCCCLEIRCKRRKKKKKPLSVSLNQWQTLYSHLLSPLSSSCCSSSLLSLSLLSRSLSLSGLFTKTVPYCAQAQPAWSTVHFIGVFLLFDFFSPSATHLQTRGADIISSHTQNKPTSIIHTQAHTQAHTHSVPVSHSILSTHPHTLNLFTPWCCRGGFCEDYGILNP